MRSVNHPYHKTQEEIRLEEAQIEAAKGDIAKFSVLYEKYYKPIFVFVFRRIGKEEITADIVSIVFMKAMANLRQYRAKGLPFSSWLFRISLNETNMYFRKNKSERIVSMDDAHLRSLAEEVDNSDKEENIKLILETMQELPEASMQLIELRFFEKRSFSEVGEILGITENNAKVKLYRVLETIKELLKKRGKLS